MSKQHRLLPVISIAEAREKDAARDLSGWLKTQNMLEQQINQLKRYRQEYKVSMLDNKKHTTTGFMDWQLFLNRLNKNIDLLEQRLLQIEQKLSSSRHDWQKSHARTKSLEHVVSRDQAQTLIDNERQQQKEQDEDSRARINRGLKE